MDRPDRPARLEGAARVALALLGLAATACGSSRTRTEREPEPSRPLYKRLVLSLELLPIASERGQPDAGSASPVRLWLIETDETGSTRRVDLGELPGPCIVQRNPPAVPMKPFFTLECSGGAGARVRLVHQKDELILLRAPGVQGDELDFEEAQRVELPIGVRVLTE